MVLVFENRLVLFPNPIGLQGQEEENKDHQKEGEQSIEQDCLDRMLGPIVIDLFLKNPYL